ncbi:hypothetical protein HYV50_05260, partial [Candidatus Pacearchaeota archaeon]|nr:hypothetical protein [Candidatus Pacearchaeota archaeon]
MSSKKSDIIIISLLIVFFLAFVYAAHVITPTSQNVVEDVSTLYNITVNNSDAGQNANITQVNITLPSSFTFVANSNGTDTGQHSFTNTSTVLSWTNLTYFVVNGSALNRFWFNATAATPGNYNITVTTLNATGAFNSNVSVSVNDTTAPDSMTFGTGAESDGANLSRNNIVVNVSATDNAGVNTIRFYLYNSTSLYNNTNISVSGASASYLINFTGLADGLYTFNATANDTSGNQNLTGTGSRTVRVDTTFPQISYGTGAENDAANLSRNNIYVNVSVTETNEVNITF